MESQPITTGLPTQHGQQDVLTLEDYVGVGKLKGRVRHFWSCCREDWEVLSASAVSTAIVVHRIKHGCCPLPGQGPSYCCTCHLYSPLCTLC